MKNNYKIEVLSKKFCESNIEKILDILKLIPNSNYKKEDILAENKEERVLYGKWEYSLVILNDKDIVGILIGYEREKEKKDEILIETVLERINEDIEKLKMVKKDLEMHLERMKKSSNISIGIPFIEEIKNVKGIKVYEKENRETLTFPNKKTLELINEYDGKILFYITKKKLNEIDDINILGSGYIVVKGDKKVEEVILKKGRYACVYLKGNHFENKISIKKFLDWIDKNNLKKLNDDINIIIEPGNLSIKKREDIFFKVSILIK